MNPDPFIWTCQACGTGHATEPAYCCFNCGHPKNAVTTPRPEGGSA